MGPSQQDKNKTKQTLVKQGRNLESCKHVFKMLTNTPSFWEQLEFKEVRECLAVIRSRPEHFPPVMGDKMPDNCDFSADGYLGIDWSALPPTCSNRNIR